MNQRKIRARKEVLKPLNPVVRYGCAALLCMALSAGSISSIALAETSDELNQQAASLTQKLQEASSTYNDAAASVASIQETIDQNEQDIADLQAKLPEKRAKAAESIRTLYKIQQDTPGLIDLVISSENFNDFISTLTYIDSIHARNTEQITELAQMMDDLEQKQAELVSQKSEAEKRAQEAQSALSEVRSAQASIQAEAERIAQEEQAEREAAIKEAAEAVAQSQEEAASGEDTSKSEATFTTSSGNTATVEVPTTPSADTTPITDNTTETEQDSWATRIDAYLDGSPLAGQGATFAAAAAQYGVDPRISPAISAVESTKGRYCFRPHNAWGWGSSSWSNWDEAIYAHVRGFASGYGSTLTMAVARKYCPPTASQWYASVLAEMNKI